MKVLVACEESQAVCKAFRKRGHEAYSCDIIECSGGHPEWHIQGDVLKILNPSKLNLLMTGTPTGIPKEDCIVKEWCGISFFTMDGVYHEFEGRWDLIIAHPPCTFLTLTGNRWFDTGKYGKSAWNRMRERNKAIAFFYCFVMADCDRIAIENPIGIMSTAYRPPDQITQPFEHGDPERKSTCLWLKNLPQLRPTNIVEPNIIVYKNGKGTDSAWHVSTLGLPKEERTKIRSRTFPGMANAMAEQWGIAPPTEKGGAE